MRILEIQYPKLETVRKEVETELTAYIHAITIFGSLREFLRNIKIKCYIEKEIKRKNGGHKTPDLLIHSENYLIVDHKYTESKNMVTLAGKVEEMREYDGIFVRADSTEFEPEIVMLTPQKVTRFFRKILNCPVTWGYELDEEIKIEQSIGSVRDSKIMALFSPMLFCPISEEVAKYKFIMSHAPLPYTACQVYIILWTLHPPTPRRREFEVRYDVALDGFNHLFPPWISAEIRQLTDTRLREALDFLHRIGWIRWLEREKSIIVDKSKGRMIADSLQYFVDRYVQKEHQKRVRKYEKELKEMKAREAKQRRMDDFF